MKRQHLIAAAITSLLVVAGCSDNSDSGGGQQMPADPLASVPDSAQASAAGLVAYLEVLADNKVEDRMPAALEGVMLTQLDNTEPIGLQ